MNFDLSEEQSLLKNLAERFVTERYDLDRRRLYLAEATGFSEQNWRQLAELGLLALPFAEEDGGFGGGAVELMVVCEALGRGLVVEPVATDLLLGGGLIARSGDDALKATWLPRIMAGEARIVLAHAEHAARFGNDGIATTATADANGWVLDGRKSFVSAAVGADAFVVSARTAEGAAALFLIEADADGLDILPYRIIDGTIAGEVRLNAVHATSKIAPDLATLELAQDEVRLAACGEMVGIMSLLLDNTLDYVRTRKQFGGAIGSFQAIQHRLADLYAELELSRSHLLRATLSPPEKRRRSIGEAKAYTSASALHLGEECIQLHGGMGTSDELIIGHGHKRLMLLASLFGDADSELLRLNRLPGSD